MTGLVSDVMAMTALVSWWRVITVFCSDSDGHAGLYTSNYMGVSML